MPKNHVGAVLSGRNNKTSGEVGPKNPDQSDQDQRNQVITKD